MYLQRAGGIFRGLDDNPVFGGHDDSPVFVGEYTHMGDDKKKAQLKAGGMSNSQLLAAYRASTGAERAGYLLAINTRGGLKALESGSGGGGGGGGGGSGGIIGSISPAKVLVGVLVVAGAALAAKKLTGR